MTHQALAALLLTLSCALAPVSADDCPFPLPPYDRDAFGGWIDADGDCEDTRAEVLRSVGPTAGECTVRKIRFVDPYTGLEYAGEAHRIDIDHVVPLAEAWRSGADGWTRERRVAFANDTYNLIPTAAGVNRSKGDRDPAEWLPPDPEAWCWYGRRWLRIKAEYRLAMDGEEVAGLARALEACDE